MITKQLREQIDDALDDRKTWAMKQTAFYNLRHGRGSSPKQYPGQPNLKAKIGDEYIEKLKPYFVQQLYSDSVLCTFTSLKPQAEELTTGIELWFDYQLKHCSNFEREIYSGIDQTCESGAVPMKIFFDNRNKMLAFDQIDPLHLIYPRWTKELYCADFLVHVLHYSEAQYRANPRFNKDPDLIRRIKGKGDGYRRNEDDKQTDVEWREGINCGTTDEQIVLWEAYYKEGGKWRVCIDSPVLPYENRQPNDVIAPAFGLPFWHGFPPFCLLRYEISRKGMYAPRGVIELTAPHESYINRTWNSKATWMQFNANPNYESDNPIPNIKNWQNAPGKPLPPGLRKSASMPPPAELDTEVAFTRALASQRIQMPDLSNSTDLSPGGGQADRVTATQIHAIVGQTGQGNDLRARIFRLDLGDIFKMSLSVLLQYKRDSLSYLVNKSIQQLPPAALHDKYILTPNGSPDSWNKGSRLQKAIATIQLIQNSPMAQFSRWSELTKWLWELDDPRNVARFVTDPQELQQDQKEMQENEIVRILNNFSAQVHEYDDDKTHAAVLTQFFDGRMREGQAVTPPQAQAFIQHTQGHLQNLAAKKDPTLAQITKTLQPYLQILGQLAQQAMPQNVVQMPGQNGSTPPQLANGETPEPPPGQNPDKRADLAIKGLNAMAQLIKSGVDVSHLEINTLFRELGIPDLPTTPISQPPVTTHPAGPRVPPQPATATQ